MALHHTLCVPHEALSSRSCLKERVQRPRSKKVLFDFEGGQHIRVLCSTQAPSSLLIRGMVPEKLLTLGGSRHTDWSSVGQTNPPATIRRPHVGPDQCTGTQLAVRFLVSSVCVRPISPVRDIIMMPATQAASLHVRRKHLRQPGRSSAFRRRPPAVTARVRWCPRGLRAGSTALGRPPKVRLRCSKHYGD